MDRKNKRACVWLLLTAVIFTGCTPVQPFYLEESGGALSTYLDSATEIQYADVQYETLGDVTGTRRPRTVANPEFDSIWDLTLEEAVATTLNNSKVIRTFGQIRNFGQIVGGAPERLSGSPTAVATVYDPAIQETGQSGVAQALSQFDAVFNSNATWDRTDRRQNLSGFTDPLTQDARDQNDRLVINNEVVKRAATGSQFTFRNQTIYEDDLDPGNARTIDSTWYTAVEAEWRQPLLRGAGTQVNRVPIILARIRTDTSLADFELAVRNMMNEVETAYWELYFFYRNLHAAKLGRDSALSTWKRIYALSIEKAEGGETQQEAQTREQYFFFRGRVEEALRDVYKSETRLRYLMGLSANDGRLIRPSDEPTRARITFDWNQIHSEALSRSVELRRQQWQIKARELELIAARNQLLPQVDVVGLYRWLGQGDRFFDADESNTGVFPAVGSQALDGLASGNFQDGQLGFQASVPIGFRRELSQVRSGQLALARERAKLEDMELEISHQLTDAIADLESQQEISQSQFNRLVASATEVKAMEAAYETGTVTLNVLLDAQRRRAEAEQAYFQSIVEYNLAIVMVHFRKGSLLDYNGVVLAEGPWPSKAYCDSHERARRRAASLPLNYGYSRPRVASGPAIPQTPGAVQGVVSDSLTPAPEGEILNESVIDGEFLNDGEIILSDPMSTQTLPSDTLPSGSDATPSLKSTPAPNFEPADSVPDPAGPSSPVLPGAVEETIETKVRLRSPVRSPETRTASPKPKSQANATPRPAKTRSENGASKVATVSFVQEPPQPKSLRADSGQRDQPATKSNAAVDSSAKSLGSDTPPNEGSAIESGFDIVDPATAKPKTTIRWK